MFYRKSLQPQASFHMLPSLHIHFLTPNFFYQCVIYRPPWCYPYVHHFSLSLLHTCACTCTHAHTNNLFLNSKSSHNHKDTHNCMQNTTYSTNNMWACSVAQPTKPFGTTCCNMLKSWYRVLLEKLNSCYGKSPCLLWDSKLHYPGSWQQ